MYYLKIAAAALGTAFYSIAVIIAMIIGGKNKFYPFARSWSRFLLRISSAKVNIRKEAKLPAGNKIYISNHVSAFDIPVLLANLPDDAGIIYKKELEKIPFLGWCLAMSPFVGIIRDDPRAAMRGMDDAIAEIRRGGSLIVFPEGTRSKDGRLGEFRRGAFMIAAKSRLPLVPVTIIGTNELLPKGSRKFRGGNVELITGKPIENESGLSRREEDELMNRMREEIKQNLDNHIKK
jgi:1-acyl-sn-glycerol-3-phosphate acyltransferase